MCGRRGCFARAAKYRADPRHQLARIERLGQIIVGADFQSKDAIHRFAACGQQKYRNRRLLAERLQKFEPRPAGQHYIQNDQLVVPRQSCAQAGGVIVGRVYAKSFALQKAFQQVDESVIVIDDEQAIHSIHFALSSSRRR